MPNIAETTVDNRTASELTAALAAKQAERRRKKRNAGRIAKVAVKTFGKELGEEAAESLVSKIPLGVGAAASAVFIAADWKRVKKLAKIAEDETRSVEERKRARDEIRILKRAMTLEGASGAASIIPGVGTAASLGVEAMSLSLETRDRVRLEEDGGSILTEIRKIEKEEKKELSQSLQRSLDEIDRIMGEDSSQLVGHVQTAENTVIKDKPKKARAM